MKQVMFILLITGITSCTNVKKVRKVIDMGEIQQHIIAPFYEENKKYVNEIRSVFVIRIVNADEYEIRVSIFQESYFKWYIINEKYPLLGTTQYIGRPVLIYGNAADNFYSPTKEIEKVDFLERISKRREKLLQEEVIIFEPEVWIYNYKDGEFVLEEKGVFPLLE